MTNIIAEHKNQGRPSPSPERDAPLYYPLFLHPRQPNPHIRPIALIKEPCAGGADAGQLVRGGQRIRGCARADGQTIHREIQ